MILGLTLVLDGHSDQISGGTVSGDIDGFYALIDSDTNYPLMNQRSLSIKPGHTNLIALSPSRITASDNLKTIQVDKRNCLFPEEHKLKLFKNYSKPSCDFECSLDYAMSKVSSTISSKNYISCFLLCLDKQI